MSLDQYRFFARQISEEIRKFDRRKIILDERQVAYAPSFLLQCDMIDFYESDLGEDATDNDQQLDQRKPPPCLRRETAAEKRRPQFFHNDWKSDHWLSFETRGPAISTL